MIRAFDIIISLLGLLFGSPLLIILFIVGFLDTGAPLFRQERICKEQKVFILIKFRTMSRDTISVASHLVNSSAITRYGCFLRRTKLDELPQLWNVLSGEMSLVGPRPCLSSQEELINERQKLGVFDVKPGLTGLAQVNKIDMSKPKQLAQTDAKMIESLNLISYFTYIILTLLGKGMGDRVRVKGQGHQD